MTSEVEERPRLITAGYSWHGSQWVNVVPQIIEKILHCQLGIIQPLADTKRHLKSITPPSVQRALDLVQGTQYKNTHF